MWASITDERRPQLVRGVGGELELAPARGLDRRGDPPADGHRAEEHDDEQDRRDQQLGEDDRPLRLARPARIDCADDDPVVAADLAPGEAQV